MVDQQDVSAVMGLVEKSAHLFGNSPFAPQPPQTPLQASSTPSLPFSHHTTPTAPHLPAGRSPPITVEVASSPETSPIPAFRGNGGGWAAAGYGSSGSSGGSGAALPASPHSPKYTHENINALKIRAVTAVGSVSAFRVLLDHVVAKISSESGLRSEDLLKCEELTERVTKEGGHPLTFEGCGLVIKFAYHQKFQQITRN